MKLKLISITVSGDGWVYDQSAQYDYRITVMMPDTRHTIYHFEISDSEYLNRNQAYYEDILFEDNVPHEAINSILYSLINNITQITGSKQNIKGQLNMSSVRRLIQDKSQREGRSIREYVRYE